MSRVGQHLSSGGAVEVVPPLRSELLRACFPLPETRSERPVIWMNAICVAFLAVGVLGIRQSSNVLADRSQINESAFIPVEVFQPPPPPPESEAVRSEELTPEDVKLPALPTLPVVAIDDPTKAAFAVPLLNVTAVTNRVEFVAVPPQHDVPRKEKTDTGPKRWEGEISNGVVGGEFPRPDFPREAVIRHESGTVEVLVTVKEDGTIEDAGIQSSSGSTILDRHAVQFLKRKWRWPAGGRREFIVPVEFFLQK